MLRSGGCCKRAARNATLDGTAAFTDCGQLQLKAIDRNSQLLSVSSASSSSGPSTGRQSTQRESPLARTFR
jgi:hypothetical protein